MGRPVHDVDLRGKIPRRAYLGRTQTIHPEDIYFVYIIPDDAIIPVCESVTVIDIETTMFDG